MTETTVVADDRAAGPHRQTPTAMSARRLRFALGLACIALAAAVIGAVGPARHISTTYSWPPRALPTGTPTRIWYAPLLLQRREPAAVTARIACSLAPALQGSAGAVTVLATARHPDRTDALVVTRRGTRLVIRIGATRLARVPLARTSEAGRSCAYTVTVADGRYSIVGGPRSVALSGKLDSMPVVTGIFSQLDLRRARSLAVQVRTHVFATESSLRQTFAWIVAAAAILLALSLVAIDRRPRPWRRGSDLMKRAVHRARLVDGVVLAALTLWWIISPAFYDDGWIWTRESMYSSVGGLSTYYTAFGANLPNDYWLEWLQHWLSQSTNALVLLRLPALLCLTATWVLCRWILARALGASLDENRVAHWTLAGAFLVNAFAWGMTLRPEFVTALLTAGVLACTMRFVERPTAGPLALCGLFVPLAVTAHHAGVVSVAPLIVVAPALFRWVRSKPIAAATIVTASVAALVVLGFVGSDIAQRRSDANVASSLLYGTSWLDELQRYDLLYTAPYGTPIRSASVVLMGIAVALFVLRRRHLKRKLLDLPSSALALGLLLLVPLPDKLPWHFGALSAIGAVAIACEAARLQEDATEVRGWHARPILVIGAGIVAAVWIWSSFPAWTPLDLRALDWARAASRLQMGTIVVLLPLLVMVVASLVAVGRGDQHPWKVPWRVAPWTALIVAMPVLAFTSGVLVVDAVKSDSWTLTRQNLDALRGRSSCGVGDDVDVALPESARALRPVTGKIASSVPGWVPPFPSAHVPRLALGPTARGSSSSPWFRLPAKREVGLFAAGVPVTAPDSRVPTSDSLGLAWGTAQQGRVAALPGGRADIPGVEATELGTDPWHFLAAPELPTRDPKADVVRVTFRSDVRPGAAVAVTAPVTYSTTSLASLLDHPSAQTLVMPPLVMFLPCARAAPIRGGVAEPPRYIVGRTFLGNTATPVRYASSPFIGLLDLYPVTYLPIANTSNPVSDFVVFRVDGRIPGTVVVPPTETTSSS